MIIPNHSEFALGVALGILLAGCSPCGDPGSGAGTSLDYLLPGADGGVYSPLSGEVVVVASTDGTPEFIGVNVNTIPNAEAPNSEWGQITITDLQTGASETSGDDSGFGVGYQGAMIERRCSDAPGCDALRFEVSVVTELGEPLDLRVTAYLADDDACAPSGEVLLALE